MSKSTNNTMFVLGIKASSASGEKKVFALKNPRRFTLVDLESGGRVKFFGTYRTAFRWISKLADMNIPGLRDLEIIRVPRPLSNFEEVDTFLG